MNVVKDIYLWSIDWLDYHPHAAFWVIVGLAVLAIVT
jgi:hypothetical protein